MTQKRELRSSVPTFGGDGEVQVEKRNHGEAVRGGRSTGNAGKLPQLLQLFRARGLRVSQVGCGKRQRERATPPALAGAKDVPQISQSR